MRRTLGEASRDAVGGLLHGWRRLRYRRALAGQRVAVPRGEVRVSYGNVLVPATDGSVRGGRVKLLHLREEFPDSPEAFNILYLVSSAQPPFAAELTRWARGQGIKVVWNQDGVAYPAWAGRHAPGLNATMHAAMRHADHILYQSDFCRASAARFLGAVTAPAEVLPNCVDTSHFRPSEAPPPAAPWILLAAGSHQHRARVLRAIEVIAELRRRGSDTRLVVAGPLDWNGAAADVTRTARALGVEAAVDVLPPYTQHEAPAIFQRAHVLLHLKYKDPCPTVVIEALACGVPVVGSKSGGLPELVGEEAGILLDVPDSWEELHVPETDITAAAITRVMRDLGRWRAGARRRAERQFTREAWLARHFAIFRQLVGQG